MFDRNLYTNEKERFSMNLWDVPAANSTIDYVITCKVRACRSQASLGNYNIPLCYLILLKLLQET